MFEDSKIPGNSAHGRGSPLRAGNRWLRQKQHARRPGRQRATLLAWLCFWLAVGLFQPESAQSQGFWSLVRLREAWGRVVALAVDPRSDSVLYLAAPGGGVWKTQDGGETWVPQIDSAPSLQVGSLALDPRFPDVLYLGTGDDQSPRPAQGVARSADCGQSWTFQARFTNQPVCTLAVDPTDPGQVFAGSAEGLFLSTDAGASWNKVLASPVTSVAFDGQGSVYAGMPGGDAQGARENILARSSDGGRTWTKLILPPNPDTIGAQTNWVSVVADAGTVSLVVSYQLTPIFPGSASSAQSPPSLLDFYRSTDAGSTWSGTFRIGQARPPVALLADPVAGSLYVAGTTLLTSADQGYRWLTIPTITGEFHTAAFTGGGGVLLLGGEKGLEPVALVPGATAPVISQLPVGRFLGVSFDSVNGIWGAGPAGLFGMFLFNNGTQTGVPGIGAVGNVAAAASGSSNVFASGNRQIYRSTDGGLDFSSRTVVADGELRAPYPPLVLDPVITSSAYVAGRRLYHTSDSGATWTALTVVDPDPARVVIALAMAPASRLTLYAATACLSEVAWVSCPATSLVWRSRDGGQSWSKMSPVSGLVNRLAVDPRQNNTLYAAIGAFPAGPSLSAGFVPGDLLRSTDGGATWASVRGNLPQAPVNAIVIDPTSLPSQITQPAQTLYVGTDAGVFVSFNAGVQWTDISGSVGWSLPSSPVTDLSLRQPDGTLLAATFGRGIYWASTAGIGPSVIVDPLSVDKTLTQGTTMTTGVALTNVSTVTTFSWRLNAFDSWISVPEPNGTLRPGASLRVAIRISAAGLQAGTYRGHLQLVSGTQVQNPFSGACVQDILVEAHVTASPAQMTIVGGNNATGAIGTALPPLQVMISDANKIPLSGVSVNFAVTSGGGSLSARTVLTNAAGIASTVLTLPEIPGVVRVAATRGQLSVTFTATAIRLAVPTLPADSVWDGVTFNDYASVGPGSILCIVGQNLAEAAVVADSSSLPTLLQTTRVLLSTAANDVSLPLFSVSPLQVRALLPADVSPGAYNLHVEVASVRSNDVQISVATFDPGIFTLNESGRGPGIFIKEDSSLVTAANPADRGATVTFYAAGLGAVNPPIAAGQPGAVTEPLNRTVNNPRVFFDSYQAEVIYSGLTPGVAGRYQVTVRVPALVSPATNVSVSLTIGGFASNRVTIPVR